MEGCNLGGEGSVLRRGFLGVGGTGLLQRDILGGYILETVLLRTGRAETTAPGPPPTRPPARLRPAPALPPCFIFASAGAGPAAT